MTANNSSLQPLFRTVGQPLMQGPAGLCATLGAIRVQDCSTHAPRQVGKGLTLCWDALDACSPFAGLKAAVAQQPFFRTAAQPMHWMLAESRSCPIALFHDCCPTPMHTLQDLRNNCKTHCATDSVRSETLLCISRCACACARALCHSAALALATVAGDGTLPDGP